MLFNRFEVPKDCEKALKELNRMVVCKYRNDDCEEDFSDVWFHIQHECDLYEEGEETNILTSRAYSNAKRWLNKYKLLYDKYNTK